MQTHADPVAGSAKQNFAFDMVSPTDFVKPNTFKSDFIRIQTKAKKMFICLKKSCRDTPGIQ